MSTEGRTHYIGIMSGTSLDAIDAVLVELDDIGRCRALGSAALELPDTLRRELLALNTPGEDELSRAAQASVALAQLYASVTWEVLNSTGFNADTISAIGVHGQTVRHRPDLGFTIQLNAPALIAELTGIDVIADFRSRDIAAGGQGAPLVPAFHAAQFRTTHSRVILNVGGIANITILQADGGIRGFDTGPGNMLLDAWVQHHLGHAYDNGGAWAASGRVLQPLLDRMLADPWFQLPPPKSTGRDDFNLRWLESHLTEVYDAANAEKPNPADVQATLLQLTTRSIAEAVRHHAPDARDILICGGGCGNTALRQALETATGLPLKTTDECGLPAQWVEAAAFAWLAWCHDAGKPAGLPAVTGAHKPTILGCKYPA
jgi:Predicted molecular chaperone distantly related to HSP70-fold metalloproteases